jgi:hypothetical protein
MQFSLKAHVVGDERFVSARHDGVSVVLSGDFGDRRASSWREAERVAHEYIGRHLQPAMRGDRVWGLVVSVPGFSALYGTPHPTAGVSLGAGAPADPNSAVMRIYRRWRQGDSARSALENAMQIVREAAGSSRGRHAA